MDGLVLITNMLSYSFAVTLFFSYFLNLVKMDVNGLRRTSSATKAMKGNIKRSPRCDRK